MEKKLKVHAWVFIPGGLLLIIQIQSEHKDSESHKMIPTIRHQWCQIPILYWIQKFCSQFSKKTFNVLNKIQFHLHSGECKACLHIITLLYNLCSREPARNEYTTEMELFAFYFPLIRNEAQSKLADKL